MDLEPLQMGSTDVSISLQTELPTGQVRLLPGACPGNKPVLPLLRLRNRAGTRGAILRILWKPQQAGCLLLHRLRRPTAFLTEGRYPTVNSKSTLPHCGRVAPTGNDALRSTYGGKRAYRSDPVKSSPALPDQCSSVPFSLTIYISRGAHTLPLARLRRCRCLAVPGSTFFRSRKF
jgi:hypothetical protein